MLNSTSLKLAAAAVLLTGLTAQAQDAGALVDALVKKGILNDQEAEQIRADMTRDFATTPAGKLNISNSITELKLYGDLRLRYQYDNKDSQVDPFPVGVHQAGNEKDRSPSGNQRDRYRCQWEGPSADPTRRGSFPHRRPLDAFDAWYARPCR